ncbi:MAG: PAS domain S-box protein [Deltaproteobacteria bacterium]|nr:PAS domain S-box protein [Deltaproteobacteria bacterium]
MSPKLAVRGGIFLGALALLALVLGPAPAGAAPPAGEPVTVQLRWLHQFQFAGYYAAVEKGFYREAGLAVTLREGGPGLDPIAEVLSGRAQFGAASNELLLARLKGQPVKVLAVIFQQSPSIFLARRTLGVTGPQDMQDRRVMMLPGMGDAELLAMFLKEGVGLDKIHRLPTSFNIDDLLTGKTDVFNAYLTNEPYYMEQKGMPYTIIRPSTYGIHFYGDALFTSEAEVAEHPELVRAFRQATLQGWSYAMEHPEEIIEVILTKYPTKKTRDHLRYEALAMRELLEPEMIEMGHMNPGRWQHMADTFAELGMVPRNYDLTGFMYDPHPTVNLTPYLWAGGVTVGVLLLVGVAAVSLAGFNRRLKAEVSERTRAEERFAAMVANVPGVIFQMGLHLGGWQEYRYLSPGTEEFFGAPPARVLADKLRLPWHPEDRERVQEEFAKVLERGADLNLTGRVVLPDGGVKWVRIKASSGPVEDGVRLATGFILDVTSRKLAEMEYLATERKIKAMSQAVEDALIMLDSQGRVRFWNPAAERLFGYPAAEAMGLDFHAMAASDELREQAHRGLAGFARHGRGPVLGTTTQIEARDRQGRRFPVEVTLSSFQLDEEWYAVGTVRDISARKEAEAALQESERRLADIVDFLPDPTLVVDNEGRVLSWNRAMERLTGVKAEDMLGKGDYEYALPFYGERRPLLVDLVRGWNDEQAERYLEVRHEGEQLVAEAYHPHLGSGGMYVSGTASLLYDAQGQVMGAIETLRDITERKRAEALMVEKEVAEEAAAQAERARREAEAARQEAEAAQREVTAKLAEIERFNRLALGREERILELKRLVNDLAGQAGAPEPFADHAEDALPAPEEAAPEPEAGLPGELDQEPMAAILGGEDFQSLLRDFCEAAGIAAAIIDPRGQVLAAARWQRACTDFHRQNQLTCARCVESDVELASRLGQGASYTIYRCKNGLTDAASPIIINGRHLANTFVGQFFSQPPDLEFFRQQAREMGFDPEAYLEAISEVPVVAEDRLPAILGFLVGISQMVATAYTERRRALAAETAQARRTEETLRERAAALSLAEDADLARSEIELYKGRLELLVEERTLELQASEERSRLLLHSAGEGIFGVDAQGRLSFINPAALGVLGFTEEEMLGQPVHALIHHTLPDGSDYPLAACPMHATFTDGTTHHVDDEVLWKKNGRAVPVEYASTPIVKDNRVVGAVVTFRDISERKRVEEEMREYMRDLERFNRLTLGREERMIQLKEEINALMEDLGRGKKYKIVEASDLPEGGEAADHV